MQVEMKVKKLKMLVVLGIFLFQCTSAFASPSSQPQTVPTTEASFIDDCSGKKTAVAMPGGTKLRISIKGLKPGFALNGKIKLTPAYTGLEERKGIRKIKGKIRTFNESSVDSNGEYFDEITVKFPKQKNDIIGSFSTEGYWNVRVEWNQAKGAFTGGSAFATIYVPQSRNQKFYKILGPSECMWETPPMITSQYYFNEEDVTMTLSHEYTISDASEISKGVDFGIVPLQAVGGANPVVQDSPLLVQQTANLGWIFAGFRTAKSLSEYSSLEQTWNVGKNQGGYFVKRLSFKRVPAEEFFLDETGECPSWKISYRGDLDIGLPTEDFIIVPQSMAYDPLDAQEFMEKMRPTIKTCEKIPSTMQYDNARVPGGGDDLIMFFFPLLKGVRK